MYKSKILKLDSKIKIKILFLRDNEWGINPIDQMFAVWCCYTYRLAHQARLQDSVSGGGGQK